MRSEARIERLTKQIADLLPSWSLAPVVEAIQAMRGVAFIVAVTVAAEVGDFPACSRLAAKVGLVMPDLRRFAPADRDFSRFDNPRQLMAYLGLTPSEHSSGASVRRGGITKAGSRLARHALVEGAWSSHEVFPVKRR
jgi:transposase